jgi:hypothetical protein
MITVNWVDPNTRRSVQRYTGTVRFEAPGIEINVELFGHQIEYNWEAYIPRTLHVLNTLANNIADNAFIEPDPELSQIPEFPEPETEPEPIEFSEFQ